MTAVGQQPPPHPALAVLLAQAGKYTGTEALDPLLVGYRPGAAGGLEIRRQTALCMCISSHAMGQEKVGMTAASSPLP